MTSITAVKAPVIAFGQWALDKLYPPHCPSCKQSVSAQGHLCGPCFQELHMITAPHCSQCGVPFAVDMGPAALCPDCLDHRPSYTMARSALVYGEVAGKLIKQLKYHDHMQGLSRYAQWMLHAAQPFLGQTDMIIPVPLHWKRLVTRYYNQASWLGYEVGTAASIPCLPHLLKRVRHTPPQARMNREERQRNMKRAFVVPMKYKSTIEQRRILLVDDVMTTGATLEACAEALTFAGAAEVNAVTLARAVRNP